MNLTESELEEIGQTIGKSYIKIIKTHGKEKVFLTASMVTTTIVFIIYNFIL